MEIAQIDIEKNRVCNKLGTDPQKILDFWWLNGYS